MAKITLRDIQLTYDGETLTICSVNHPLKSVSLDANAVGELIDFVQSVSKRRPARPLIDDNRRESFRVPIVDAGDLRCRLTVRGHTYQGQPSNISMTGVYIQRRLSDPIELRIGDEIDLQMTSRDQQIDMDAIVRRLGINGYGLFFPRTMKGDTIAPPSEFRRMVMELQRRWMATRSDLAH